jgi:hypothetical protein
VRIVAGDNFQTINEADFDGTVHERWRETPQPAASAVMHPLSR